MVADYEAAEDVPEERFIWVHYPRRGLVEAVVELIGRPKISLRNLTVEFEAIVVPANLFAFNPATEEGEPNGPIVEIGRNPVPPVAGFDVVVQQETVSSGATAAFGLASWAAQSSAFSVESSGSRSPAALLNRVQQRTARRSSRAPICPMAANAASGPATGLLTLRLHGRATWSEP